MRTEHDTDRDDVWRWIWDDADELRTPPEEHDERTEEDTPSPMLVVVRGEAAPDQAEREAAEPSAADLARPARIVLPARALRGARSRVRRRLLAIAVAASLLAVAAFTTLRILERESPDDGDAPAPAAPAVAEQRVVAFALWNESRGPGYVAVVAYGGGKEPVAVVLPDAAAVTIPGHGFGTVADATGSGDVTLVQVTVENVLGIRVDDAVALPLEELAPLVDAVGLLDLAGDLADGEDVVRYLSKRVPGPERVARWQEVLTSLLAAAKGAPERLEAIPARVRGVFAAGADVFALPTEDIGSGLVTPDDAAIAELVSERFVASESAGTSVPRLVVLNGNGEPGIGEEVARLLVPEGFRLVSSGNLRTFDLEKTVITATSVEYLDEARLARRLLGTGEVVVGGPPSGVGDVTVAVGDDFGRP